MLYSALRWVAGIALYWFYADIRVTGRNRIPESGPVLFAVNHHNALIDALIVGWIVPRRVWITAKATLTQNPALAVLFRLLGIVPLRRASDEHGSTGPARNEGAFSKILDVMEAGRAVLIFPEGKSHSESSLAPLKTGLARIALQARDERGISNLIIVPVGLSFDEKGMPATDVRVNVGFPISITDWHGSDAESLTDHVEQALRELLAAPQADVKTAETWKGRRGIIALLVSLAAAVGYWTHRFPIAAARRLAVSRSSDPDQPAMLTIMYSLGFLAGGYILAAGAVGYLWGPVAALLVIIGLATGAYWTAFRDHPRGY